MKTTTVSLATKSVEIAQMLTSLLGKKRLLLTLAATLVCLRTATASRPAAQAAGHTVPLKGGPDEGSDSAPARKPYGDVESKPIPPTAGGPDHGFDYRRTQPAALPGMQDVQTYTGATGRPLNRAKSTKTPGATPDDETTSDSSNNKDPEKVNQTPGQDDGSVTAEELLEKREGEKSFFEKYWKTKVAVGATMATAGFMMMGDACHNVASHNEHQEVLTSLTDGDLTNYLLPALIGLLIAGGLALAFYTLIGRLSKDQNNAARWNFWLTVFVFVGSGALTLGVNFMEQNATNSSTAFGNALIGMGEVAGEVPEDDWANDQSLAEVGATLFLWIFIVAFVLVAAGTIFLGLRKAGKC